MAPAHWTSEYYLALIFFALAFMSKAVVVTFPFVLLLLDYWPLKRSSSSRPWCIVAGFNF